MSYFIFVIDHFILQSFYSNCVEGGLEDHPCILYHIIILISYMIIKMSIWHKTFSFLFFVSSFFFNKLTKLTFYENTLDFSILSHVYSIQTTKNSISKKEKKIPKIIFFDKYYTD